MTKLYTNHIPTGPQKSFQDLIDEMQDAKKAELEGQVKQAAAQGNLKTADDKKKEQDEGESSGQLDVEPLHQVGESTPSPHKDKESGDATKVKEASDIVDSDNENNDVADDSGHPKAEEKCHNDPEAGRHREGDGDHKASGDEQVKEANLDNIPEDKRAKPFGSKDDDDADSKDDDKDDDKEATAGTAVKVAECECGGDCDCKGGEGDCSSGHDSKACSAAAKSSVKVAGHVKLSNLDGKSKSWLKTYWLTMYPAAYVEAMLADK